jgi:hypothetical protein
LRTKRTPFVCSTTSNVCTDFSQFARGLRGTFHSRSSHSLDTFQQNRRRFILPAFTSSKFSFGGDEFATEGFSEDGLTQLFSPNRTGTYACFDRFCQLQENLYSSHYLKLLLNGGERYRSLSNAICPNIPLIYVARLAVEKEISERLGLEKIEKIQRSENDGNECFHAQEQNGRFPYLIECFQ